MIRCKGLSLFFFLILSGVLVAQSEIRFRNFTINDGLSQSSITCIVQDELHSFWIGTQDGLNRYDGKTFEIFTSAETKGLKSEHILCSAKDKQGNLWFGTNNGLSKYDLKTESFKSFNPKSNTAFQIVDIAVGRAGELWLATAEAGVYRFNYKTEKFTSFQSAIPTKKVSKIFRTEEGTIIVASIDKGIFICNEGFKKIKNIEFKGSRDFNLVVNRIRSNSNNTMLLATNQGVYELDIKSESYKKIIKELYLGQGNINVTDVFFEEKQGWVIATNGAGLFVVDTEGKRKQFTQDIFQKSSLLHDELNIIFKDNAGSIWLGSQRGLSSFDPINKGILGAGPSGTPSRGIPTASVWSLKEGKDGKSIFIGSDRAVSRLNRESGKYTHYYRTKEQSTIGTGEMAVLSMLVVNKNRLLVACADGLFELTINGANYSFKEIHAGENGSSLMHKRAYSIVEWKDGKCIVGTKDGALMYDYRNHKVKRFEHNPNKPQSTISKGVCRLVYKDNHDRIWLATSMGGLNILYEREGEIEIRPYEFNTLIRDASADYISSIYHDKEGCYWLGTLGSGLVKWNEKDKRTSKYTVKEGLPNNVIYGLVSDNKGSLWLSTNKGLCSFSKNGKQIKNYTEVDGLMSNEFNLGAFMKTSKGELYFGSIYGFNFFNPADLKNYAKDIEIIFTRFKLENEWLKAGDKGSPLTKPIFETENINLSYLHRSFTLKFQPSDLSNPELIHYKYVLEGSDEGEILIGSLNEIHFNALAPGSYTLRIFAKFGNGNWSTKPGTMKIVVAAPFWETWWFWSILIIVLVVVVRIFIRRRMDAARREQVRLEMKVRTRTKEIQKQNEKIEAQKLKIEEERNKVIKQQELLQVEKDKSEKLLKNVIPESTAEELIKSGRARARAYKTVSVLFTDFVGFTNISDRMSATELVKRLDVYFTRFDEIIVKNNLEKIKTIGDAYMCAGGVPVRNNTNPIDTCLAALQIQAYMQMRKNNAIANDGEYWELRLGINTGEVTAGVIGSERLAYDIWGATVNQAQRMEMLGEAGKVTITGATYQHIEPYFECTFKGKAQSKSRGLIDMYTVERIKPDLSVNGEGVEPNKRFQEIVNLHLYSSINYYKAERHIMKLLEKHLPKGLHYHSIAHSKDVVHAVEHLALMENVTDEDLFLLKSAANYHDAGFIEQYDENEPIGARLAGEILPKYGYTKKHIEKIKELIFVTKIPHEPKNKLEEIICDADLDYLGRDDFHEIADKLRRELREHGKINSDRLWDEIQVGFLKSHKYFTETSIKTRRKKKMLHLREIEQRLEKDDYKD